MADPSDSDRLMFTQDFLPLLRLMDELRAGLRSDYLDTAGLEEAKRYAEAFTRKYPALRLSIEGGAYGLPRLAVAFVGMGMGWLLALLEQLVTITEMLVEVDGSERSIPVVDFKTRLSQWEQQLRSRGEQVGVRYTAPPSLTGVLHFRLNGAGNAEFVGESIPAQKEDPQFQLCREYALQFPGGYIKDRDISSYAGTFLTGRTQTGVDEQKREFGPASASGLERTSVE